MTWLILPAAVARLSPHRAGAGSLAFDPGAVWRSSRRVGCRTLSD